jgi:hypothetical protein
MKHFGYVFLLLLTAQLTHAQNELSDNTVSALQTALQKHLHTKNIDSLEYSTHLGAYTDVIPNEETLNLILSYAPATVFITLPPYTQGKFCDFEDYINRKRKLRIDFSVK